MVCIDEAIPIMHELLKEFGFADVIIDPKRPGPNYYDDCINFSWIDHLIKKHKSHLSSNGESLVYLPKFVFN